MTKTIFELTEGNAPALTDYALTGEDPLGTHVLRRTTWQSIRNLFVGATTAANDFIVGNGTVWQKKTLAETKTVLGIDAITAVDGWVTVTDTWTYATATTFTISGDKTGVYSVGDKIKLTQTTEKFFYVIAVSYSSPNTTITICGGTSYTLANATITSPYYSHAVSPVGFPLFFTVNNGSWSTTGTAFTNAPTGAPVFSMQGKIVVLYGEFHTHATSGGTGIFKLTFPAGSIPSPRNAQAGSVYNQSGVVFGITAINTSREWSIAKYDGTVIAGNDQYFNASISYIVP